MLFSSSSLLLLGVLSTVRGHADYHHHHHRAIARQLAAVAAPPAANGPPSTSSLPGQAAPAPAQPTPPGSLAGPVVPSASRSSVSSASTSALPDATLTATNPNIPPLSDLTSGEPSSTPIFTFQPTLGAPGPYPGAPPLPSSKLTQSTLLFLCFFLKKHSLLSSSNPGSLQVSFSYRARANWSSPHGWMVERIGRRWNSRYPPNHKPVHLLPKSWSCQRH